MTIPMISTGKKIPKKRKVSLTEMIPMKKDPGVTSRPRPLGRFEANEMHSLSESVGDYIFLVSRKNKSDSFTVIRVLVV